MEEVEELDRMLAGFDAFLKTLEVRPNGSDGYDFALEVSHKIKVDGHTLKFSSDVNGTDLDVDRRWPTLLQVLDGIDGKALLSKESAFSTIADRFESLAADLREKDQEVPEGIADGSGDEIGTYQATLESVDGRDTCGLWIEGGLDHEIEVGYERVYPDDPDDLLDKSELEWDIDLALLVPDGSITGTITIDPDEVLGSLYSGKATLYSVSARDLYLGAVDAEYKSDPSEKLNLRRSQKVVQSLFVVRRRLLMARQALGDRLGKSDPQP
jgi:hypothetical protein